MTHRSIRRAAIAIALGPLLVWPQAAHAQPACLQQSKSAPVVLSEADPSADYPSGTVLDARDLVLETTGGRQRISVKGDSTGLCIAGGSILGQHHMCTGWRASKKNAYAAIGWETDQLTVDGVYIHNVHDALRPRDVAQDYLIQNVWLDHIHDDCLENDNPPTTGLIEDSLFDGCHTGISTRKKNPPDASNEVITLDRVLLRLEPLPEPPKSYEDFLTINGVTYGTGTFFKTYDEGPRYVIKDSIFAAEMGTYAGLDQGFGHIKSCQNNVMVWLGEGDFPGELPDCFEVTTDPEVWRQAVANWHARHPEVGAAFKPEPDEMGAFRIDCANQLTH